MLLIGYFEGIDSERGLEWRCADSLPLREFLRLSEREGVPDHSWLSRTRSRLPLEVHDQVSHLGPRTSGSAWPDQGRAHRRRCLDDGSQRGVAHDRSARQRRGLSRDADPYGPREWHRDANDLVRLDRNRKANKLSNADWQSSTDPDARIAKLKDGRTHLAYKPEHAMDLDTGAVVAAEVHAADQGDTATMPDTLANAIEHLTAVDAAPTPEAPAELIAGNAARRAVYNNRTRLLSRVARQALKLRAELMERSFALILDRGGMRRVWAARSGQRAEALSDPRCWVQSNPAGSSRTISIAR